MAYCAVFGCSNCYRKDKGKVKFFRFPSDPAIRAQWIRACRRKDSFKMDTARICSVHFEEDAFEKTLHRALLGYSPKGCRKLKKEAVPRRNLPTSAVETEVSKRRRERYVNRTRRNLVPYLLEDDAVQGSSNSIPAEIPETIPDKTMENNPLDIFQQNDESDFKKWDVFQVLPPEEESGSTMEHKFIDVSMKILKVLAYIVTFCMVLGSAVLAKGTLLFMTSQIKPGRVTEYCNRDLGREKHFTSVLPEEERIAWVWALLIAVVVPELGAFIRSLRICVFKSWEKPEKMDFFVVAVMETFHAIGVSLLVFCILPNLDVIRGAMITNCVCFIPGVLRLLSRDDESQVEFDGLPNEDLSGQNELSKRWAKTIDQFNEEGNSTTMPVKSFTERIKSLTMKGWLSYGLDLLSIVAQGTGFILWPFTEGASKPQLWAIPFALLFISAGWWENYVSKYSPIPFIQSISKIKDRLKNTRYFTYAIVSLWKIFVIFIVCLFSLYVNGQNVYPFFVRAQEGFQKHKITVEEVKTVYSSQTGEIPDISDAVPVGESIQVDAYYQPPICVLSLQIIAAYLCYIFGKFACKIWIQEFSFAFPVNLTVPVTICFLIAACTKRAEDACSFYGSLPDYLFFDSPSIYMLTDFISRQHVWVWMFWLLSQTWITLHIWNPKCDRVASTEKLFVNPTYSGALIDQSVALNRRRDDEPDFMNEELDEYGDQSDGVVNLNQSIKPAESTIRGSDRVCRIYACATMWHETREEMMEMLKSIMRLDSDQSARHKALQYFRVVDPDYYKLEIHVFFDDAFELTDDEDEEKVVNQFVKLLVATIDEAAMHVHEAHIKIRPPKKYPTPYGGRLVWTLPGKNKMIAHLKDKTKIRQKKRWSQVMYMYYLLGHRLMELPLDTDRKEVRAENTFILALDGDIDFQPQAVQLLVDRMKRNRNLGAACGRIHPIGSGPMVWYQRFEYAIGHWLQKATEHIIGSVLCSPGCFSLFRGKALMDDDVMRKYTTKSKEARHYVQFDQGEDRWLCTLLLQRGHHVEYSAASDAYTHCPEGFNEFYNQRRRWVPSTMANIMDLLGDFKKTVKCNANISTLYIGYQMMLMAGTILGPGTIFLMLVGAFVAAFKIDQWTSFYYNLIPILIYMGVCFFCKANVQLWTALIISTIYGLVMIAVLVGIMMQIAEDGPLAPSSLFLFVVASEFIVTAVLHPKEIGCLPHGITYYITVPSMYLLLIIYSVFNMNNVSWGTREIISRKRRQEMEEEKKRKAEEAKKSGKKKSILGFFGSGGGAEEAGSMEFSFAGLFKCMLCTHQDEKKAEEKRLLLQISESIEGLGKRLENMERVVDPRGMNSGRRRSVSAAPNFLGTLAEEDPNRDPDQMSDITDSGTMTSEPNIERDDLVNPYWIEDPELKHGEVGDLSRNELQFWKDLLDKYLFPIAESDEEKKKIAEDLKQLRDKSVFAFFMLNAFFVVIVFLLQLNKDLLHVNWPLGVKNNITYFEKDNVFLITKDYLELEPIGLVFVFFFGVILVVQFIAMLIHRMGTLSHILASTELSCYFFQKVEEMSGDFITVAEAIDLSRAAQKLKGVNDDTNAKKKKHGKADRHEVGRRKTIHHLENNMNKQQKPITTLDSAFRKRIDSIKTDNIDNTALGKKLSLRRGTMLGIERAKSLVREENERRQSMIGVGFPRRRSGAGGTSFSDMSNASYEGDAEERNFRSSLSAGRAPSSAPPPTNYMRNPNNRKSVQFLDSNDFKNSDV